MNDKRIIKYVENRNNKVAGTLRLDNPKYGIPISIVDDIKKIIKSEGMQQSKTNVTNFMVIVLRKYINEWLLF